MSSSTDKFTHVAFINIQEAYCHRNNLECQFTISPLLTVTCSDFIGVFKVGWKSTRDFVSKKTVFIPANFTPETALETAVLFDAAELPKDLLEFYQFCYVCNADQRVHGVSPPFQFFADQSDWELVENVQLDAESESPQPTSFAVITDEMSILAEHTAGPKQDETQIEKPAELDERQQAHVKDLEEQVFSLKCQLSAALEKQRLEQLEMTQKHETEIEAAERQHAELLIQHQERSEMEIRSVLTTLENLRERCHLSETRCQQLESSNESKEEKLRNLEAIIANLKSELLEETAKRLHLEQAVNELRETTRPQSVENDLIESGAIPPGGVDPQQTHCPVCQMEFLEGDPVQVNEAHVLAHLERVCPVCNLEFSPDDERSLISHVDECLAEHRTSLN